MLIITEDLDNISQLDLIKASEIIRPQYASLDDIRWHKTRLVNHNIIILIPGKQDVSYHLKYLLLLSNADIIVLTDNKDMLSKYNMKKLLCFDTTISADFFNGCLAAIKNRRYNNDQTQIQTIQTMSLGKFILNNINQTVAVSHYIAQSCNNSSELRRGIFELLTNAFEHGIYNIGFDRKQDLISDKKYFSELKRLTRDPEFKNKTVELVLHKKNDGIYININDPGLGFDYQPYLNYDAELSSSISGRGIAYVSNYCFDQLIYKNDGKSVYAIIHN